jgi:hypothetical protein
MRTACVPVAPADCNVRFEADMMNTMVQNVNHRPAGSRTTARRSKATHLLMRVFRYPLSTPA